MKIEKDRKNFLRRELREYEKITPMTEEEREALHEWVHSGRSVHDNGSYACYEGGRPLDFLDCRIAYNNLLNLFDISKLISPIKK